MSRHIPALDGIRGAAILMVLFVHFNNEAVLVEHFSTFGALISKMFIAGGVGVDLFFILSGFLITGILVDTKNRQKYFVNFYMRRALRIFPLYYGVLVVFFVIYPTLFEIDEEAENLVRNQWWFWLYLQNFPGHPQLDKFTDYFLFGHFWTLAVEEHFYLIWPLVVYYSSRKRLKCICLLWTAFSLIAGLLSEHAGYLEPYLHWQTIAFSGSLTLGAYLALVARDDTGLFAYKCIAQKSVLVAGLFYITWALLPREFQEHFPAYMGHYISWFFFVPLMVMVLTTDPNSFASKIFCSKFLCSFGKYSYGIYVYHGILRPVFWNYLDMNHLISIVHVPIIGVLLYLIITIGISFFIAWVSWHFFEKKILILKKFFYSVPSHKLETNG